MIEISSARRTAIVAGVMTGMLLAALEATIVGTAMPTVVASLGGLAHYSWVFSAYLLTSTVTVPLWGKLSDLYGRGVLYQIGIAVFLVGSVLSGLSQSMGQLIAARALQGMGAGALIPLGMTVIGDIFTLQQRAKMQGLFSGVWGLSSIIGPLVGGFITDQLSWRWVFFINVPFGIAAAIIIGAALREEKRTTRPKIDYAGAAALTAAVTLLMLGLVEGGTTAALVHPRNLALFGASALLLVALVYIERRAAEPVVPLELFRNRIVTLAVVIGFLAGVGMFGAISFVPLFAQGAMGSTATAAGSLLTPLMLAWVSASVVGGRLLLRTGYRPLVVVGLLLLTTGFGFLSTATRTTPRLWLMGNLAILGCGLGLTMLTLLLAVQHAVPREQLGIATSLNQFSRSIGGAVGVALLGAIATASLAANLDRAARAPNAPLTVSQAQRLAEQPSALVESNARSALSPRTVVVLQESLASSMRSVFLISGVISFLALLASLLLPRGTLTHAAPDEGERFVMAELTTIDAQHEPECEPTSS